MTKIRNSMNEFYRLEIAKEKICELEYRSVENIQSEALREKG